MNISGLRNITEMRISGNPLVRLRNTVRSQLFTSNIHKQYSNLIYIHIESLLKLQTSTCGKFFKREKI